MRITGLTSLVITLAALSLLSAANGQVVFNHNWQLSDGAELKQDNGQQSILLTRGELHYTGDKIRDGIVEFDIYSEGERAFVFVNFRQVSEQESEVVYLRTHKSNAPDTLQYAPVYQGRSAWQLYHGEKGTAPVTLPANSWIPVKIEFRGDALSVWVNDLSEPVMDKVRLSRSIVAGGITIRGNIPRASQASYSASIRNIRVTPLPSTDIAHSSQQKKDSMSVTEVSLSPVFIADKSPIKALPEGLDDDAWSIINAEYDGIFELLKWRTIPTGIRSWAAAARFTIDSTTEQTCTLHLGFSDAITLLLNNQAVAFVDASYRYAQNRQEGLLHAEQMQIFLPLNKGRNTVTAIVADSFGGWGLQASLSACDDVVINQSNTL